jgi:hypothetical protein
VLSFQPLLANIYLHYVFDLWADAWREKIATRDLIVVRYADDLVVGFQHQADAERFLNDFRERLAKFGLELHGEKTRLIEFGRFAGANRSSRGEKESRSCLHFSASRTNAGSREHGHVYGDPPNSEEMDAANTRTAEAGSADPDAR